MRHSYIDQHSDKDSFIHHLDPRVKVISLLALLVCIVLTEPGLFRSFLLYGLLLGILLSLSKVPVGFVMRRSLVIIPFVLLIAIFLPFYYVGEGTRGLIIFSNIVIKSFLSIFTMILLISTTRVKDLLKALEKLKVPSIFILIMSFMYRYIFVIQDEFMKMQHAKESRSVGGSRWFHTRVLANLIGVLFVRSYERAENVYLAMCSRGFGGEIKTLKVFKLEAKDLYFLGTMIFMLMAIKIWGG